MSTTPTTENTTNTQQLPQLLRQQQLFLQQPQQENIIYIQMFLFQKKPTPKEQSREWIKKLKAEQRTIDREMRSIPSLTTTTIKATTSTTTTSTLITTMTTKTQFILLGPCLYYQKGRFRLSYNYNYNYSILTSSIKTFC